MGLERKILDGTGLVRPPEGLRSYSFLQMAGNQGFPGSVQKATSPWIRAPFTGTIDSASKSRVIDVYSAAAASEAFGLVADIMKSLMRGTISDLNREPLNTP